MRSRQHLQVSAGCTARRLRCTRMPVIRGSAKVRPPTHTALTNEVLRAESASRTDTHSEDAVLRLGHLWGVADIPTINWLRAAGNGWDVLELPEDAYWPMLELSDAADAFCRALTACARDLQRGGRQSAHRRGHYQSARCCVRPTEAASERRLDLPVDAHLYYRSHRLDSSRFALASGWAPARGPFPIALAELAAQLLDVPHRLRLRLEVPW